MALIVGDITASSGLAKRIYDNWTANALSCGFAAAADSTVQQMLQAQAFCIAQAIVDEIAANGEAVVSTSLGALQREDDHTGTTVDTQPPSAERSLPLR